MCRKRRNNLIVSKLHWLFQSSYAETEIVRKSLKSTFQKAEKHEKYCAQKKREIDSDK